MALVKVVTTYETWVEIPNEKAEPLKDRICECVQSTFAFQQNVSSILKAQPNLDVSEDAVVVNVSSNTVVDVAFSE